jgi:hypothetical protein
VLQVILKLKQTFMTCSITLAQVAYGKIHSLLCIKENPCILYGHSCPNNNLGKKDQIQKKIIHSLQKEETFTK